MAHIQPIEDALNPASTLSLHLHTTQITAFLAVVLRLSTVVFMFPPLSNTRVPFRIKSSVVLALAAMIYPLLMDRLPPLDMRPGTLLWSAVTEVLLGMVMAFALVVILAAFDLAGQMISYMTGLAFAQVVDPTTGGQTSIFNDLLQMMAILLLFQMNLHHLLLKTIVDSFIALPVGSFTLQSATVGRLVLVAGQLFVVALKLAAPVMVVLLLTQAGFGVIAKFAPRINVLVTSFPLTIGLGLFFAMLSVPLWGGMTKRLFMQSFGLIQTLVGMKGGP
jgi:flagellar biosynthesis protein FliR